MIGAEAFRKVDPSHFHFAFLSNNVRHDGRTFAAFRNPLFSKNVISNCHGSASLRCGETFVIAGVKAEISELELNNIPENKPNISSIIENSNQLSSPEKKSSSKIPKKFIFPNVELPKAHAFEIRDSLGWTNNIKETLESTLSDLLNSPEVIDYESFRVAPDSEFFWIFYIQVNFLEFDGNIYDTSLLVSLAALENTQLPIVYWDNKFNWWREGNNLDQFRKQSDFMSIQNKPSQLDSPNTRSIIFYNRPISITFTNIFDTYWIADPCKEEEEIGISISLLLIGPNWSLIKRNGTEFDIRTIEPTLQHISSVISDELKNSLDKLKLI